MLKVMAAERREEFSADMHEQAIAEAIDVAKAYPNAKGFLVIDLDDVRDNSRYATARKFNWIFRRRHGGSVALPSIEEAVKSIRAAYEPLFGREYYGHVWREIETRGNHFKHVPLVDPKLPERLSELQQAGFVPILWLTARDRSQTAISRQTGIRKGLPDIPVYAEYPEDDNIIQMKTEVLSTIAQALPGKMLYMIDDNAHLVVELEKLGHPQLTGIQFETHRYPDTQTQFKATWSTMLRRLQAVDRSFDN